MRDGQARQRHESNLRGLAEAVDADVDLGDEHSRYALYKAALQQRPCYATLRQCLLDEPDVSLATSVRAELMERVDHEQRQALVDEGAAGGDSFLQGRLNDLELLEELESNGGRSDLIADLLSGSDWAQRRAVSRTADRTLMALAERGRTRRVRQEARRRLQDPL